jgi:hypothetical protein
MNLIDIIRKASPNVRNNDFISKSFGIEKAEKDISKLIKKTVMVTRNGKVFQQTVYVSPETGEKEETPIGGELSPEVKGMDIKKYSEKALLITGDTYVNIDTLKKIKNEIGVGTWNQVLKGWIFPIKFLETILGFIWSDLKDKGEDEKANAVQNQKNESLQPGDKTNIQGVEGNVTKGSSDENGTKYDVTLDDGTKLEGVDEKVMNKEPEKDDKKISEIINNVTPESRTKSEKKLYGLKHIENIHQYSLPEYMKMHGLLQDDIDKVIGAFKNPKTKDEANKRASSGGANKEYTKSSQIEGLTKRQLIGKLVFRHYQAVKKAIEDGEELKPEVLEPYADLKEAYFKKRQAMSEETKRKISEALKKNGIDKENYKPKDGQDITIEPNKNSSGSPVTIKTKDYTDIPALDISIPKNKILDKPKPYFIPDIDISKFARNSYTLSAVKIGEDQYLVALDGFESGRGSYMWSTASVNKDGNFAIMSLDTYIATQNYYQLKSKEQNKIDQLKKHENFIQSLKDRLEEAKKIGNQERVEYFERNLKYYSDKKPSIKRLKVLSSNRITYDQMYMIQAFNKNSEGNQISDREVWGIYGLMKVDFDQKSLDLQLQQESLESTYTKGVETSYGDSGTKNNLLKDYGVKVKRQNGDEINESEINQIKNALDSTAKVFGHNVNMNKEFGLKISHSGNVLMHAMNASGVFIPTKKAIGVTAKGGDNQFRFTFGHEYAHFIDHSVGRGTGNWFASDKQGTTANQIAVMFGKLMKKPGNKSVSGYWGRSCEKFARAMEQYHAIEVYGDNVTKWGDDNYYDKNYYLSKENYQKIKPLIQQFLQENKEILKSLELNIL